MKYLITYFDYDLGISGEYVTEEFYVINNYELANKIQSIDFIIKSIKEMD